MTILLNDLSYIPPNNEHNEPTQGDIGETSNEPTQATRNEFEELYASANEELYPVKGFKLPASNIKVKKTFKTIELGYESIHACEHDCCLFWGYNNKDWNYVRWCNTSRWKDSNTLGKKVPKKVLRYFSIIPRLPRLYKSSHTAKDMIWHATGKYTEPGKMQHPVDGGAWKKFDNKYLDFAKEPRNVRLGLAADGFNAFGNLSQKFNMRAMVLWTINDFPARSSLSRWSGQGYKTCPTCNEDTPSVRVLSKTAYVSHKRFLKKPHKWRRSLEFNGQTDKLDPPKEFLAGRMLILVSSHIDRLPTRVKGKHPSYGGVKIKRNVHVELNWTKRSIFYELEYWSFLSLRHNLDIMHIEKKDYMLKAQIQGFNILCELGPLICLLSLDIMIHLVIHLPLEALEGGPIRPRLFPNKAMQEEFPDWFGSQIRQRHVDNYQDPEVSTTNELFALANGQSWTPISVNSCVVDGVRYVVHSRDERRTTQNSGICSPGPDGEMYYGQLQEIFRVEYLLFKVALFRVKWFDTSNKGRKVKKLVLRNNMTPNRLQSVYRNSQMSSANVARSHGGDGGGEDRPPPPHVPTGCEGCFINRGKGKRKPNLGGKGAGRLNTRDKTRNLSLKEIAEAKGLVSIHFDVGAKQTLNPLGPHAAHWSNYIGEVVRSVPLYYPSWEKVPKERKATLISNIGTLFDLRPQMKSPRWTDIYEGINMHLQKAYNTNKASFKAKLWRVDPQTGTYNVEAIRQAHPEEIIADKWIKAELRHSGEEMKRLEATGEYTEDETMRWQERVKSWAIYGVWVGYCHHRPHPGQYSDMFKEFESGGASGCGGCGDDEESGDDEDGDGDD
ncbi:gag-pol polyprotein [Tanacetum coccineum]